MAYDDHLEEAYRTVRKAETSISAGERARRIEIKIDRIRINLDPVHDVFNVEMTVDNGEWRHTAGSEADLHTFLEGMRAGVAMMGGCLDEPFPIPTQYNSYFTARIKASENRGSSTEGP